jgi:hypothetical protein
MSQKLRFILIPAVAALAAIAATGCGSSQSHKSALVAAADPICQKVAEQREAANSTLRGASSSTAKTLQVLTRIAPEIATIEHNAVSTLSKLKPPASEAHEWPTILVGMRLLADDTTKLAAAAKANNIEEVRTIDTHGRELRERLAAIAKRSGFSYCGISS